MVLRLYQEEKGPVVEHSGAIETIKRCGFQGCQRRIAANATHCWQHAKVLLLKRPA